MLDLRSADSTLGLYQRRFFDDALPPQLSAAAFAKFKPRGWSVETLAWGRRAWEARALDEYRSHVGFVELLHEVSALSASWDVVAGATRLVRDEARHVELCLRLSIALGGDGVMAGEPSWVRSDTTLPLLERVLRTVAGSLCLGETVSAALLAATLKVTKVPLVRSVLELLTRDESFHSQFGWRLLTGLWPRTPKAMQKRVRAVLKHNLAVSREMVFEDVVDDGPRNPFGDLQRTEREATFTRCLERDVLRRFKAAGVLLD